MHIISRKQLLLFSQRHADVAEALNQWYRIAKVANWKHLEEVKRQFPAAEAVVNFTVFNIKGNKYRLIIGLDYEAQVIYIKYVLTHAEYGKDEWKHDPHF